METAHTVLVGSHGYRMLSYTSFLLKETEMKVQPTGGARGTKTLSLEDSDGSSMTDAGRETGARGAAFRFSLSQPLHNDLLWSLEQLRESEEKHF